MIASKHIRLLAVPGFIAVVIAALVATANANLQFDSQQAAASRQPVKLTGSQHHHVTPKQQQQHPQNQPQSQHHQQQPPQESPIVLDAHSNGDLDNLDDSTEGSSADDSESRGDLDTDSTPVSRDDPASNTESSDYTSDEQDSKPSTTSEASSVAGHQPRPPNVQQPSVQQPALVRTTSFAPNPNQRELRPPQKHPQTTPPATNWSPVMRGPGDAANSNPSSSRTASSSVLDQAQNDFNVNLGNNRLLVKAITDHNNHVINSATSWTSHSRDDESDIHHSPSQPSIQLAPANLHHHHISRHFQQTSPLPNLSNANANANSNQPVSPYDTTGQMGDAIGQAQNRMDSASLEQSAASLCYSPFALLLLIVVTMVITVLICLLTHILLKHLNRHQFDLAESNKQFEIKQAAKSRRPLGLARPTAGRHPASGLARPSTVDDFGHCAFDNPYFADERASSPAGGLLVASGKQASHHDPSNFIDDHISNLHNRQVTSSVKQLSVLGSLDSCDQVIDLTTDAQKAKMVANQHQEGDLIAVDISGQDFIGLGFDVAGGIHEGIFVRSVFASGPARESGCIQPGDRIKCINICFDNMSLEDAKDILNCGSPYKMRLLLEKGSARASGKTRLASSSSSYHDQQQPITGANALSVTKTYIRRLISPHSSSHHQGATTNNMNVSPTAHSRLKANEALECRSPSEWNYSSSLQTSATVLSSASDQTNTTGGGSVGVGSSGRMDTGDSGLAGSDSRCRGTDGARHRRASLGDQLGS